MNNKLFSFYIYIFLVISSCSTDDTVCTDLGYPLVIEFSYVDGEGKNLFAGDNPQFSKDDFALYEMRNGAKNAIPHHFSNDRSKITAQLLPAAEGTFFIQLDPTLTDTITFIAPPNETDPCKSLKVDELMQNNNAVNYDSDLSCWQFVK